MKTMPSRTSFTRVIFVLAMTSIVLIGIRLAAPIINPLLFAVVLSLILSPAYAWLRRKLPPWLALLAMVLGLVIFFALLFAIVSLSISRLTTRLGTYASQLVNQETQIQDWLQRLGLTNLDITTLLNQNFIVQAARSLLGDVASLLNSLFLVLATTLFLVAEGPALFTRLRTSVGKENSQVAQLARIGEGVIRQFYLRAVVNLATGAAVVVLLLVLGVEFPLLWGVLTFFLSYIPYIGLVLAIVPGALLALAEYGLIRALLVILGVVGINLLAENLLSPLLMSRGLQLSPAIVFISFVFWTWLLGATGAFLAVALTYFLVAMFDTFPGTRWLASIMKK
jgi:AI-2 transport protein TqsA